MEVEEESSARVFGVYSKEEDDLLSRSNRKVKRKAEEGDDDGVMEAEKGEEIQKKDLYMKKLLTKEGAMPFSAFDGGWSHRRRKSKKNGKSVNTKRANADKTRSIVGVSNHDNTEGLNMIHMLQEIGAGFLGDKNGYNPGEKVVAMPDAETLEFVQNQKKGPLKGGSSSTSPDSTKLEEPEVRFVENITNMETEIQVEDQKTSAIIDVNNEALGEVNASRANSRGFSVLIKDISREYESSLIFLIETHADASAADRVIDRLGFDKSFVVNARGHSGGLWCLWKASCWNVEIISSGVQSTRFWSDNWVSGVGKLSEICNSGNQQGSNPPDYIVWNTNSDGVFTICEACTQLAKELRDSDIRLFDFVWRWNGPQHIRDYSLEDCERNPSKEWAYRKQLYIVLEIVVGYVKSGVISVMGFGIIKLNYDATSIQGDLFVACGGLIRDDHDNFIHDFSQRIGRCSIVEVELWSILYGMRLVADRHMKKVIVESDSLAAINLIHEGCPTLHPCFGIVEEIKNLYNEFEHCSCRHILREANILANTFAKHGLSISTDSQFFCNVPTFALDPFQGDVSCIFGQLTLN
ncbi:hypothetical protein JHK85_005052 [Glycine max]|nr:hypothetical protein JHK85_005052 [Glycine max]